MRTLRREIGPSILIDLIGFPFPGRASFVVCMPKTSAGFCPGMSLLSWAFPAALFVMIVWVGGGASLVDCRQPLPLQNIEKDLLSEVLVLLESFEQCFGK